MGWPKLRAKLLEMKKNGKPVCTERRNVKNEIMEVGDDYVKVKSEQGNRRTGKPPQERKITRKQIEEFHEGMHGNGCIRRALKKLDC